MSETLPETTEVKKLNHLEFKDENLAVNVEILPSCMAKFTVTISPRASQAAYEKAVKSVVKEVSLPGFRKGKAPQDKVVKLYANHIQREWERLLVRLTVFEAIALADKKPYTDDSIDNAKLIKASLEEGSQISFQVEYAPEVPTIKLADISVKRVHPEPVSETAINDELLRLQLQKATWKHIEERGLQEGDYVDLTIASEEKASQEIHETARFLFQEGKMAPWMYNVVKGLKPGETADAVVEDSSIDPENPPAPEELQCKISLKGIYNAELPELDEEFAKQFDSHSIGELRNKIESRLLRQNTQQAVKTMEGQIIEQLLVNYPFDIPDREHLAEAKVQYQRMEGRLTDSNISVSDKVRMLKEVQRYVGSLPNNYRLFYIARSLARHFHIQITEQELSAEITHHLMLSRASYDTLVDETMDPRLIQAMIYNHLLLHKVIQFILKNAQVIE